MTVMTAGEQKRRAGSARGRRLVTAVPGQPNVMAGPWPGAGVHGQTAQGERHGRAAQGKPGRPPRPDTAGTVESPPPVARTAAALPSTARVPVPRQVSARPPAARTVAERPGVAQSSQACPPAARPQTARTGVARSPETRVRPARTRVRLTRRGRVVVAGLMTASMVLVAALAWLAGTAKADAAGSGVPSSAVYHSLRSVVVLPGQSLWSIATRYEPRSDPRNVIQEIIDLNALSGTSVQPGQHLWLPRG